MVTPSCRDNKLVALKDSRQSAAFAVTYASFIAVAINLICRTNHHLAATEQYKLAITAFLNFCIEITMDGRLLVNLW